MANALTITIDDAKKKAICREVVALCGKYSVRVEPAFTGNGNIVLFRKHVLYPPKGTPVYQGGAIVNEKVDKWDANEVYAVVPLTTTDGVTSGTLNLQYEQLVQDFVSRYGVGSEVPLKYEVYDIAGEGLAGSGEFRLKVVEPYTITENQNLNLFKGDKGDPGQDGEDGADAGFGNLSASAVTGAEGTEAAVSVSTSGPNTAKNMSFSFTIPRGNSGQDGEDGESAGFGTPTSTATKLSEHSNPTVSVVSSGPDTAKVFAFQFGIPDGVMPKPSIGNITEVAPDGTTKVEIRNQGTENPILDFWLKRGKSAYECAVARGYTGTEDEWLQSLVGGCTLDIERATAIVADAVAKLTNLVYDHEKEIDSKLREIEIVENEFGEKTLKVRNYNRRND